MSEHQIQNIFDRPLVRARRARAQARGELSFLLTRTAQDAAERLMDASRSFERALFIGDVRAARSVLGALPEGKIKDYVLADHLPVDATGARAGVTALDEEALPYAAAEFDVIISLLTLHHTNDLPGALTQLRRALKPDGILIAALFGGATLTELRQSFYAAEERLLGGLTPRVAPFLDFTMAASLLQRAGFALPVVDTDRVMVNYADPARLFLDLRELGETNALTQRSKTPATRGLLAGVLEAYRELFAREDGTCPASFEILWLTGWAPHESQQKPLKPGSAKSRLADALGVKEVRL